MVFVVLGTWEMPFVRPLVEIEDAVSKGLLSGPVVVQSGNTNYVSRSLKLVPFFGKDDFERMYEQASLVICQAGIGSIMLGLRKGKRVIAVARRKMYDEHVDDHQLEILDVFSKAGVILPWRAAGDFPDVLRRAEEFVPASYPFLPERISSAILSYLADNVKLRN